MNQPRAKLGFKARARSTIEIIEFRSPPKPASAKAALARVTASSPATANARRAKSAPVRRSAAGFSLLPSRIIREQHIAAQASAGPKLGSRAIARSSSLRKWSLSLGGGATYSGMGAPLPGTGTPGGERC